MTRFRIWHERKGGRVHLAVFAGRDRQYTHGKCGDLCMTVEEFDDFEALLRNDEPPHFMRENVELVDRAQEREDNGQFGVGARRSFWRR